MAQTNSKKNLSTDNKELFAYWESKLRSPDNAKLSYDIKLKIQENFNDKGKAVEVERRIVELEKRVAKYMLSKNYTRWEVVLVIDRVINNQTYQTISNKYPGKLPPTVHYETVKLLKRLACDEGLKNLIKGILIKNGDLYSNGGTINE